MFIESLLTPAEKVDPDSGDFAKLRDVPGSNFGRDTDYRDENVSQLPLDPPCECLNSTLHKVTLASFHILSSSLLDINQ
jgi:hypothetical protein